MGNVTTIKKNGTSKKEAREEEEKTQPKYAEVPMTGYLLSGTDAFGDTVYFFEMKVTGMRDRTFGPFDSRSAAVRGLDAILNSVIDGFLECENEKGWRPG